MQEINKISAYIGFAIKSGSVLYGIDNIINTSKKIQLIIMCNTNNQKVKFKLENYAEKNATKLIETKNITLNEITHKNNVKVIAILNKNIATAILNGQFNSCYNLIK